MENNVTQLKPAETGNSFDELNGLCRTRLTLLEQVGQLNAELTKCDTRILEIVGHDEEGKLKFGTDDYDVETTGKVNRTVDQSKLPAIAARMPVQLFDRVFKKSYRLDLKEYRYMQNNESESFDVIKDAVTSKPGKTGLVVKPAKKEA